MNTLKFAVVALTAGVALSVASESLAEKSSARAQFAAASESRGFRLGSVSLHVRRAGAVRSGDSIVSLLKNRGALVAPEEPYVTKSDSHGATLLAPHWALNVRDGGDWIRYHVLDSAAPATHVPQPTETQVEAMGRNYIANYLSDLVVVGSNERLVYLGSRYKHEGGQAASSSVPGPDIVSGWAAIFGREVDGEVVIGGGSIVAVVYQADAKVVGFDIDWPTYDDAGLRTDVVSRAELGARVSELRPTALDGETRTSLPLECGLFDPGGAHAGRRTTLVQPACVDRFRATHASPAGPLTSATITIVPGARTPINQAKVPWFSAFCAAAAGRCTAAVANH